MSHNPKLYSKKLTMIEGLKSIWLTFTKSLTRNKYKAIKMSSSLKRQNLVYSGSYKIK